jgi:hypothetical protein
MVMKGLPTEDMRSYGRCDCTDNFPVQVLSDTGNFSTCAGVDISSHQATSLNFTSLFLNQS